MPLRRSGFCFLVLALILATNVSRAEPSPYHIYMIQWRGDTKTDEGFKDFFQNSRIAVTYTVRNPAQDKARLSDFIEEIKEIQPDLVYTWGTSVAKAINPAVSEEIPVVNCMVSNPVVAGLTEKWGPSAQGFSGVSHVPPIEAQLNAMKRYRDLSKLSILYNSLQSSAENAARDLAVLAQNQGIEVQKLPLPLDPTTRKSDVSAIPALVDEIAAFGPDFLYLGPDSFLYVNRKPLFEAVNHHGLASFAPVDVFLTNGDALFGLVGSYFVAGQYCAFKAAQILVDQVDPGTIDFDPLRNFSLKVNMETARRLNLYPPMNILPVTTVIKTGQVAPE